MHGRSWRLAPGASFLHRHSSEALRVSAGQTQQYRNACGHRSSFYLTSIVCDSSGVSSSVPASPHIP